MKTKTPIVLSAVTLTLLLGNMPVPAATLDWAGGNGTFLDPAMWGGSAPAAGDTVRIQNVGPVAVSSGTDAEIGSMSVSNSDATFNFGASALTLSSGLNVSATAAYAGDRGLHWTSGVVSVGGRTSFNKQAYVTVSGPSAEARFFGDQLNINEGAVLHVLNGAMVTNTAAVNLSVVSSLPGGIVVSNATWNVNNATGGFGLTGNATVASYLHVLAGGVVNHDKVQRLSANGYSEIIVDGAGAVLKANQLAMQNSFARMTVRNGGFASAGWCFWLGRGGNSYSNEFNVVDGGSAQGPVWFGYNSENAGWPSSNNTVRVSNGSLRITNNPFNLRDECNLVLQGTNTTVTTSGSMRVFRGGRIVFCPPAQRSLDHAPLAVSGSFSQIDADCTFIVDEASAFACARNGGGNFTVVTTTSDTTARFQNVTAPVYATVTQANRAITVKIENLGRTFILIR
jgi:hypothetical protein